MNKHTEAPWNTEYENDTGPYDGYFVEWTEVGPCRIYGNPDDERVMADICLVKAAPEIMEALELADAALSGANMDMKVVERKVKSAIAKARGEK